MQPAEDSDEWGNVINRITILGDKQDVRYAKYPFSAILAVYRIAHVGVLTTRHPYDLTRVHQSGSCILASLEGEGTIFVDGEWVVIRKGDVCLLPPFAFNSIRSTEGQEWTFAWVKYIEDEGAYPVVTALSPVYGQLDGSALKCAILGLHHHLVSSEDKGIENLWVELIHRHVLMFSQPNVEDDRLWNLWTEVQQNLSYPWGIAELAARAHVSSEHLRRLCRKQFGRSPKQQLEHLRMRKARILLADKGQKIEQIALEIGYKDIATFSNAFKKIMGFRPSEMR